MGYARTIQPPIGQAETRCVLPDGDFLVVRLNGSVPFQNDRRTPPSPMPREALPTLPKPKTVLRYSDWNESVGRYCFNAKNAGKRVRLAVDPLVLQRAAAEGPCRHHFATPELAAEDFRVAVVSHIDDCGWDIGSLSLGSIPSGLAKLALQVFAVFGIAANDEGWSSYWRTLWNVLGRTTEKSGVKPDDLDYETHQRNWSYLTKWANDLNKGRLGKLPVLDSDAGGRRHVRLPLTHGLLRMEDIQGLSTFFSRIGLTPGEEVEPEDLLHHLQLYADDAAVFRGAHARRVLQDERLPLAADQIASAAAQWDGEKIDLAKSRDPAIRLWLSVHTGADTCVRGGLVRIDPNGGESDVSGVDLANLLKSGRVQSQRAPEHYRPFNDRLVVLVRSMLNGRFVEARYLRPGDEAAIVRPSGSDGDRFVRDLCRVAIGERVVTHGAGTRGLPNGWVVFCARILEAIEESDIPQSLGGVIKIAGLRISLAGGLRVRRVWMLGAGPTLFVRGGESGAIVVDGLEHAVADGCLHPERCPALNEVGVHEAWIPGRHRTSVRFRVAVPRAAKFSAATVDAGWSSKPAPEWPERLTPNGAASEGAVRGPVIEGRWQPVQPPVTFMPAELVAVRLATALSNPAAAGGPAAVAAMKNANVNHPNLLVRQLARAVRPGRPARNR